MWGIEAVQSLSTEIEIGPSNLDTISENDIGYADEWCVR
jgi:hypothetical protein